MPTFKDREHGEMWFRDAREGAEWMRAHGYSDGFIQDWLLNVSMGTSTPRQLSQDEILDRAMGLHANVGTIGADGGWLR